MAAAGLVVVVVDTITRTKIAMAGTREVVVTTTGITAEEVDTKVADMEVIMVVEDIIDLQPPHYSLPNKKRRKYN